MLGVASAKTSTVVKRGKEQEAAPGHQSERDRWPGAITTFSQTESHRTLEMRGCRQDRQSSQEETSWWDSTSTRLR